MERSTVMYQKVDTSLNFVEREKKIVAFWKENQIFEKSIEKNKGGKEFSFFDGPPTANGKPHIGHILTRVMKDIVPRFQTMKGKHVLRKAGWDTHGLPVELEVEKTLGMDGKQDIEKYGIEPFVSECKKSVWKYQSEWEKMSDRVGYWVDMDRPITTIISNRGGGRFRRSIRKGCFTRGTRSCRTARAAGRLFLRTRWRRAIKT